MRLLRLDARSFCHWLNTRLAVFFMGEIVKTINQYVWWLTLSVESQWLVLRGHLSDLQKYVLTNPPKPDPTANFPPYPNPNPHMNYDWMIRTLSAPWFSYLRCFYHCIKWQSSILILITNKQWVSAQSYGIWLIRILNGPMVCVYNLTEHQHNAAEINMLSTEIRLGQFSAKQQLSHSPCAKLFARNSHFVALSLSPSNQARQKCKSAFGNKMQWCS